MWQPYSRYVYYSHKQGCQMRFVKIPPILSTVPDLSSVVIRKRHRENRETMIVKPQLIVLPVFWLSQNISVCV